MMRDNAGQHEDIFKNRNHARREHFIQRVDVGGHARHQPAHRVLVEKPDVHVLQVAENLPAQIEHHLLPGPLHQVGLDELQRESEDENPDVEPANLRDAGQRSVAQPVANPGMECEFGDFARYLSMAILVRNGPSTSSPDFRMIAAERHHHVPLVRTQIRKQPPHQPAVVRFA